MSQAPADADSRRSDGSRVVASRGDLSDLSAQLRRRERRRRRRHRRHAGATAYLEDLGVDGVWISPWYPSPMADGGYDVSDFTGIHPLYGNIEDADAFIAEAHDSGLRVLVDIVPNHTSDQHPWFQAALAAPPVRPNAACTSSVTAPAREATSHRTTGSAASAAAVGSG